MILRTVVSGSIKWISNLHLFYFLNDAINISVMNRFFNKQAASRNTILSFVEEHTTQALEKIKFNNHFTFII